ncbi:hypothetical protein [Alishewanella sp. HL-SH05]|uniref:hypothetical protein n=1 Tax=Alishewanella sp. HL-SH05 TaxID=3461145 RepID=UPI0040435480
MTYSVRLIRVEAHGDREVLVTDHDGMPPIAINMYLARFRARSHSYRRAVAHAVVKVHLWAESLNIDLLERIKSGEFLHFLEIESFAEYLRYRIDAPTLAPQSIEVAQSSFVCRNTFKTRASQVTAYLEFIGQVFAGKRKSSDPYNVHLANFISAFRKTLYEGGGVKHEKARYGLTDDAVQKLLWWVDPSNPLNPFQERVRIRNQLVIWMFLFSGIRQGELLSLRPDALVKTPYSHLLRVTQNSTLDQDPRANPPDVKTFSRVIPVPKEIAECIDIYIQTERKQRGRITGKVAPYLFLNSALVPRPMTYRCVYHIFERLKKVDPTHFGTIQPYQLRHTFNDLLALDPSLDHKTDEFKNVQRDVCGWSSNSEQGINYTKRSREILAARALQNIISQFKL